MPIEEIKGYREFQRDTAAIIRDFPKELHEADVQIAREWLEAAQSLAQTSQAQQAASSIQVNDEGMDGVTFKTDSPLFFGAEFGGQGKPSTMHFPPHQGRRGYWLYPARRANDDHFQDVWDRAVGQAMERWDHKE